MITQASKNPNRQRGYVEARGLRTYYEAEGDGEPVILLHGGLCTVETFEPQVPALAARHRVFVPERRGHGRTADVAGPITYDNMADDTIAFLDAVGIEAAHLVGYSDGAMVAVRVALRRPKVARKLVLIGQHLSPDGVRPEMLKMLEHLSRESLPPMLEQLYSAVSPDGPAHFAVVLEKLLTLWRGDTGLTLAEIQRVTAPTLVMGGDDDLMSLEHLAVLQRTLPAAQIAVVPGASHGLPMEKPELVNRLILDFLAPAQVKKMMGSS